MQLVVGQECIESQVDEEKASRKTVSLWRLCVREGQKRSGKPTKT
jgi:hypothetical protein